MRKLLILSPPIPPNHTGGDGKFAFDIANAIAGKGIRTILFSPFYNGSFSDIYEKSGLRNIKIPIEGNYKSIWDFPIWTPSVVKRRDNIFNSYLIKLDLLSESWIHEIGGSIYNNMLRNLKSNGNQYSCHLQFVLGNYDKFIPNERPYKKLTIISQNELVDNASSVFFLTEVDSKMFGYNTKRFKIVPNGIRLDVYKSLQKIEKTSKFSIFIGGRLHSPMKGFKEIIPVLKSILRKRDITINICAPDKTHLYAFSEKEKENINFFGWKSITETQQIIKRGHITLSPAIYEPFGLLGLESLASNVPLLSTSTGVFEKLIIEGENGFLIDLKNQFAIENLILSLNDNPEIVARMARQTWKSLENYDISEVANLYLRNLAPFLKN